MKRFLFALVAGVMVFTMAFASAASLDVNGETIQAGYDGNLQCDPDGVNGNWGLETSDNTVRYVRIDGIDAACTGESMWVRLDFAGGGLSPVFGPVTIVSGQAQFPFTAPYPTPESITSLSVWIEG